MEHNVTLTGDQARLLIELLTNPSITFSGAALLNLYVITGQLLTISNVQPPPQPPLSSS